MAAARLSVPATVRLAEIAASMISVLCPGTGLLEQFLGFGAKNGVAANSETHFSQRVSNSAGTAQGLHTCRLPAIALHVSVDQQSCQDVSPASGCAIVFAKRGTRRKSP